MGDQIDRSQIWEQEDSFKKTFKDDKKHIWKKDERLRCLILIWFAKWKMFVFDMSKYSRKTPQNWRAKLLHHIFRRPLMTVNLISKHTYSIWPYHWKEVASRIIDSLQSSPPPRGTNFVRTHSQKLRCHRPLVLRLSNRKILLHRYPFQDKFVECKRL